MMGFFSCDSPIFLYCFNISSRGDDPSHPLKDGIAAVNDVPFHIKSD